MRIIKSHLFNTLDNYTKGGLIERAIIQIIKNNNSPFGKFENILKIDCFLNKFKDKSYEFNKKERDEKIKKIKYYKELKEKYSNFNYNGENILFIQFLSNAKEWDIAFIIKNDEGKVDLCLIQMSINKDIKKIQEMLTNFINKKIYICTKIKMIYNIRIDYVNILFILSKQFQNKKTLEFLDKFRLPYIYFNNENGTQNFLYQNNSDLTKFVLGVEHHYITNEVIFKEALKYKKDKDYIKCNNDSLDEKEISEDYEEDEDLLEKKLSISDILIIMNLSMK